MSQHMAHDLALFVKSNALSKRRMPYLDVIGMAFSNSISLQKLGGEASSAVNEGSEMRRQASQRLSLDG